MWRDLAIDVLAPWRDEAVCLGADPMLFDVDQGHQPVEATRLCRSCPVRTDCLEAALALPEADDSLVWGGTTFHHRRQIRAGNWTRAEAMAAGDRIAEGRSVEERLADEPWLASVDAAPVYVRRNVGADTASRTDTPDTVTSTKTEPVGTGVSRGMPLPARGGAGTAPTTRLGGPA